MTLDEAVLTLYETLGEPTDFRPTGPDWVTLDPTSAGYIRLANLLNSGQTACANFKQRRGAQVRFGNLIANTNVTVKEVSVAFDIDALDTYKMYINKADLPNPLTPEVTTSGRFENSFFTIYDETYTVDWDNYDAVTDRWEIYLSEPVPTDPTDRTTIINKNSFYFLPSSHPWVGENFREPSTIAYGVAKGNLTYVLKINNISDQEEIKKADLAEDFLNTYNEFETPTEYILFGKEIRFNTIPSDGTRFNVEYYRTPSRLSDGGEIFEIPEQFHYGIIMWATWQGLIRLHELETALLFKRDWYDFMNSTKNDNDYKWERTNEGSGTIRRK
jgi:hypothetical protein